MNYSFVKQQLIELKLSLNEDLERGRAASEVVELEQSKVGRLSRMDAMQQQEMQKASRALIQSRLANIDRALEALNQGDYGFCELCGEDIPASRLDIRPEALMCVSCQQKQEQNSGLY